MISLYLLLNLPSKYVLLLLLLYVLPFFPLFIPATIYTYCCFNFVITQKMYIISCNPKKSIVELSGPSFLGILAHEEERVPLVQRREATATGTDRLWVRSFYPTELCLKPSQSMSFHCWCSIAKIKRRPNLSGSLLKC